MDIGTIELSVEALIGSLLALSILFAFCRSLLSEDFVSTFKTRHSWKSIKVLEQVSGFTCRERDNIGYMPFILGLLLQCVRDPANPLRRTLLRLLRPVHPCHAPLPAEGGQGVPVQGQVVAQRVLRAALVGAWQSAYGSALCRLQRGGGSPCQHRSRIIRMAMCMVSAVLS